MTSAAASELPGLTRLIPRSSIASRMTWIDCDQSGVKIRGKPRPAALNHLNLRSQPEISKESLESYLERDGRYCSG
jgi:hypothetical protein